MITRNLHQAGAAACLLMALYASPAQAADIWVSGTGSDLGGDGSSAEPFRTIGRAMVQAVPHDVIKVLSGDYGIADGEVFPIAIKHGVDIIGQEGSPANYPRIGGDVEDGDVRALFEVVADTADRTGILISGLRFVGEDTANEDAPSAIYVENADGYKAWVAVENSIIERSRMNDSGSSGRPAILGRAGAGGTPGNSPDGEVYLSLAIFMCTIVPTDAGGVKFEVSADATPAFAARADLVVSRSSFTLSGSETAPSAIDLFFHADADDESFVAVRSWNTERNVIMDNDGDGLVVRQIGDEGDTYLNFRFKGNLIADNAGSALYFDGIVETSGEATVTSNTLAGNARYGVEFVDSSAPAFLLYFQNNIVWDNGLGSGSGWDPTVDPNLFTHNDWQGLFGLSPSCTPDGDDNVDADPGFVNATSGDYHLADTSCVIAKGTNSPVYPLTEHDIDAEDRVYGARVDIGADEYHPEE